MPPQSVLRPSINLFAGDMSAEAAADKKHGRRGLMDVTVILEVPNAEVGAQLEEVNVHCFEGVEGRRS